MIIIYKMDVLNLAKFTVKHLCRSLLIIKLQASGQHLYQEDASALVFSCKFWEISTNSLFTEPLDDYLIWKSLFSSACNFAKKGTPAQFFYYEFCQFFGRLLLSICLSVCQEHFKLNARRMRATILWSLTSSA